MVKRDHKRAKREGRGQKVKTFTEFEPLEDLEMEKKTIAVHFSADAGEFAIYLPDYVVETLDGNFKPRSGVLRAHQQGGVFSTTMEGVIETYKSAIFDFLTIRRTAARKRVIVFSLKYNSGGHNGSRNDSGGISFCGTPALHVDYRTFWLVGGKLFTDHGKGRMSHYGQSLEDREHRGDNKGEHQIDWTEAREEFFRAMKASLEGLTEKLIAFTVALAADPDRAIASFAKATNLLPAPKSEDDE